jgi:hypothetical protein
MQARSPAYRAIQLKVLYYPPRTHTSKSLIHKVLFSMSSIARSDASKSPSKPSTPRLSASLVVVNARNQILLVQRNARTTFGGVHVFPGGNYDKKQDDNIQMTAIRVHSLLLYLCYRLLITHVVTQETFEESGLLFAHRPSSYESQDYNIDQARSDIHAHKLLFKDFVRQQNYVVDTGSLLPFTQWITPPNTPRRFHTYFFLAFLSETSSTGFTSGVKENFIPTPDGGQEVVSAKFIGIDQALRDFKERKLAFMPPQYYILYTLSRLSCFSTFGILLFSHVVPSLLQGNTNTSAQRRQVEALARGAFGSMTMSPLPMRERDEAGRDILTYEGDETRGGLPGRLHRASFRVNKGEVVSTEVVLQRNFDVFTEIDWVIPPSKL